MVQYYNSGFINFRNRKVGIVCSGQSAEHITDNYINENKLHPLKHQRIQQLAKEVKDWTQESVKRYSGIARDDKIGIRFKIIIEVYTKIAILITCYKY